MCEKKRMARKYDSVSILCDVEMRDDGGGGVLVVAQCDDTRMSS